MKNETMKLQHALAAATVALLWGGNLVASKIGVEYLPPFFYTGTRFAIVAMLMVWFVPLPSPTQIKQIIAVAFVFDTLHVSFLALALHMNIGVSTAAITLQLGVPFSCILGVALFRDRLNILQILGIVICFSGLIIVTGTPNISEHIFPFLVTVAAAMAWAVSNIMVKKLDNIVPMQLTVWLALMATPQMFIISLLFEGNVWPLLPEMPMEVFSALMYSAIISTIVGYGLWSSLVQRFKVSQVTPFSLLTPVFGMALGQLFFTETLTDQVILGGAITIAGVGIIIMLKPKMLEMGEHA